MGSQDRREREKQMRRRHIMDAARVVFAANGFGSGTMEQIAQRADYKPATLYLYFKNKHELYASLTRELMEHLSGQFNQWAAREDIGPMEKLALLPELMMELYDHDPTVLVALFRLQASQGIKLLEDESIEELNKHAAQAMRNISSVFRAAIENGDLTDHHPNAMADSVWAIFTGMVLWEESKRFFNPRKEYLRSTLSLAINLFVQGGVNV